MKNFRDPILVPIAMPFVCGPGVMAFVMLHPSVPAILLAWSVSALVLLIAIKFKKLLNPTLIEGLERFSAFILAMLAVEMIISGLKDLGMFQ